MKYITLQNARERARTWRGWILILLLGLCFSEQGWTQVRAGSAYLKLLPGTRQQNLGNGATGGLDLAYSLYSNPAAAGFLREWQVSASATRWIADISNVSLLYGTQLRLRTPWSNRINLAFGANYQNVGEFDATRGAQAPVSANDLLLSSSLGLPFGTLARNFSLGVNVKYLRTELAQFRASSFVYDVGALWRSPRFRLSDEGLFGIVSAGISVNQLGEPLRFITEDTPLPRTYRGGLALNVGTHDGVQLQLMADYRDIRDEVNQVSFGVEAINILSFLPDALTLDGKLSRLLSFRGSYIHNSRQSSELVGKWSWGFSFRFDDYMNGNRTSESSSFLPAFPPKNAAFQFDGGGISSERFASVYQGSGTLHPLAPEYFEFIPSDFHSYDLSRRPEQSCRYCDAIELQWQATRDPDLYDKVNYILLLAKDDSLNILRSIERATRDGLPANWVHDERFKGDDETLTQVRVLTLSDTMANGMDLSLRNLDMAMDSTFYVQPQDDRITFRLRPEHTPPSPAFHAVGDYFWAVLAYDYNGHVKPAQLKGSRIGRFYVETDPFITLQMTNRRWQDEQYVADLILTNRGRVQVEEPFSVDFFSYSSEEYARAVAFKPVEVDSAMLAMTAPELSAHRFQAVDFEQSVLGEPEVYHSVQRLLPGESDTLTVPMNSGRPYMMAAVDRNRNLLCEPSALLDTLSIYDLEIEKSVSVKPVSINIEFEFDKPYPRDGEEKRFSSLPLVALQQALTSPLLPKSYIEIVGHTDERGPPDYNEKLSLARANWVKDFLVRNFGFDSTRICAIGHGEDHPLSKKHEKVEEKYEDRDLREKLHKANRRVEIRLRTQDIPCAESNEVIRAVFPGDTVTFNLKLTNHGPLPARDFRIVDNLDPFLRPLTHDSAEWHFDEFLDGQDTTLTYKAQVKSGFPTPTFRITNTAQIIAPNDTSAVNDKSTTEITAIDLPIPTRNYDLQLTSSISADSVETGGELDYTVTVANLGPATAYGFFVESSIANRITVKDIRFGEPRPDSVSGNVFKWTEMPPARVQIEYNLQVEQKLSGSLEIQTKITKALDDTLETNNTVKDTIFVKGEKRTYTVRPGDSLSKIALKFYGNISLWREIFKANRGLITDPNVLEIGWQLFIPVIEPSPAGNTTSTNGTRRDRAESGGSDNGELNLRMLLRSGVSVRR